MEAIVYGRPTYLSDPAWTSKPWCGFSKTPIDQLADITSALANNFAQAVALDVSDPTDLLHAGLSIVDRCWEIEASLRQFYIELEAACQPRCTGL